MIQAIVLLLCTAVLFAPLPAQANGYALTGDDRRVEIWQHMQKFQGPPTDLPPLHSEQWQPLTGEHINRGISRDFFWLRLRIDNPGPQDLSWVVFHETSYVDLIDVYLFDQTLQPIAQFNLSDHHPYASRPVDYRKPAFNATTAAGEQTWLYLRVGMLIPDSLTLRFQLSEQQAFQQHLAEENFAYGLYFGASLALIVLSLLLWLSLHSRLFLVYSLYLAANFLLWFSLNGYAFRYLWPQSPIIHNNSYHVIYLLFVMLAVEFSKHFFDMRQRTPRLSSCLTLIQLLLLAAIGLRLAGYYLPVLYISYSALVATAALPLLGWYFYRKGLLYARWYVLAWSIFVTGLLASVLSASTNLFNWGMHPLMYTQLASLLESFTLLLALSEKVRSLQSRYEQADRDSHHDALTGIGNRRLLNRWFRRWLNNEPPRQRLWLLMIDIDHFKVINDSHGHKIGDQVLENLATLMTQLSRPQDILVRYGGEEFLLLIESENPDYVHSVAERLRQQFAMTPSNIEGRLIPHTLSIGISEVMANQANPLAQAIDRADNAMYQAKRQGRNRVILSPVAAKTV